MIHMFGDLIVLWTMFDIHGSRCKLNFDLYVICKFLFYLEIPKNHYGLIVSLYTIDLVYWPC